MKFNNNALLFTLENSDLTVNYDTLPIKKRNGQDFIMITLTDHSMFDRYYKDDILTIRLQKTCENGTDALVLLPDNSVILRQVFYKNDQILLKAINNEFYDEQHFPKNTIQIIGIVIKAIRIN
ncbi:MAG: S24 family peptidase [Eubacterium sp.]